MAQLPFDATNTSPDMGMDPVPAGWYNAMIDSSEMKPTSTGDGAYLECQFKILDGQYAGRRLFTRLNLRNNNPTAVEIAYKELACIIHAVKEQRRSLQMTDSQELHGIPLKVKVKITKDKNGVYDDKNEITSYKGINEATGANPVLPGAPPVAAAPPATPAGWGVPPGAGAVAPPAPAAPAQQPWQAPPGQPAPAQPWAQQPAAPQSAPPPAAAPQGTAPPPWQAPAAAQPPAAPAAPSAAVPPWQQ